MVKKPCIHITWFILKPCNSNARFLPKPCVDRARFFGIIGLKEKKECDFLLREKNQITQAIQVTMHLSNEETKKRELEGLIEAMKTYNLKEGLILTENEQETLHIENFQITVLPIWKWLLSL